MFYLLGLALIAFPLMLMGRQMPSQEAWLTAKGLSRRDAGLLFRCPAWEGWKRAVSVPI
jgi:hypothetical protein